MNQSVLVSYDAMRSLAFGGIGATYTAVGTPFEHPMRMLTLQNLTDATVIISIDGVIDHKVLPAGGQAIFDYMSNRTETTGQWSLRIGSTIYVKASVAPTTGAFYVSTEYGKGE